MYLVDTNIFLASLLGQNRKPNLPVLEGRMRVFIQIFYGAIVALIVSVGCIWGMGSFGAARHTISIIGAIAIFVAGLYLLRSRWVRWGSRQLWLKYHQRLASMGLCLVLFHSAFQPLTWHSWLTFLLALLNLGTGIGVSLTAKKVRQILLRLHLFLAPILLISIVFHGQAKLDHDAFFPLTDVHDVHCAKCHPSGTSLFRLVLPSVQPDLFTAETIPEEIRWWFVQHDTDLPESARFLSRDRDIWRTIRDDDNHRDYHIKKEDDKIAFYADNVYRSYTCITCHIHNTPEIQLAHELHGVLDYHRCLVCHQAEIDGTRYGRRRANWEYNPN